MVGGANRAVLYDLYPYVWDLRNTALVAKAFVCWLGKDTVNPLTIFSNCVFTLANLYELTCFFGWFSQTSTEVNLSKLFDLI